MIQSRRVRRGRLIVAGLTVGLVLAIILSAFALSQRSSAIAESEARATQQAIAETERAHAEDAAAEINRQKSQIEIQARDSLARNLASYAHDNLNSDPQLSLLLALEAANQTYLANGTILPEAQAALQRSIQEVSRLSFTIPSQSIGQPYISFSPDGSSVIARYFRSGTDPRALSSETSTLIWDATTGELLHTLPTGVAVDAWPVTPYIGIIDLAEDEIILNLWNPIDGKSRPPINLSNPESLEAEDLTDVVLSPDAARLIAFWLEGRIVQIWDLESITQTHSLSLPRRPADGEVSSTLGGDGFFKVEVPSNATISADGRRMYILAPKLFLSPGERRQRLTVHTLESAEELRALDVTTLELGPLNSSLSISPDERFSGIVAEEYVEIRDFETGEMLNIQTNSPDTNFNALSFSPDGMMLAAADVDGIIKVWDVGNLATNGSVRRLVALADPGNLIHDIQFSPDGQSLATASSDGAIKLWNIGPGTGSVLPFAGQDVTGDEGSAAAISHSPVRNQMAVAVQNGLPAVYDLDGAARLFQLGDIHDGPLQQIDYSPDGSTIATCSFAGPFQIWDAENGTELFRLDDFTDGSCSFEFHSDGRSVFLGFFKNEAGWHQELALPNLEPGILIEADSLRSWDWQAPHEGATISLAYDEGSSRLAVVSDAGELFIWDTDVSLAGITEDSAPLQPEDSKALIVRESGGYLEALLDPAHDYLIVTAVDGSIKILGPENPQISRLVKAHNGQITAVTISPDGSQLASSSQDRTIKVWDIKTGDALLSLTGQYAVVTDLAFSPDGTRLYAAGEDGAIQQFILDVDELIKLAQSNVTRALADEECRQYLFQDACPGSE